jgi:hypothetical protein
MARNIFIHQTTKSLVKTDDNGLRDKKVSKMISKPLKIFLLKTKHRIPISEEH